MQDCSDNLSPAEDPSLECFLTIFYYEFSEIPATLSQFLYLDLRHQDHMRLLNLT